MRTIYWDTLLYKEIYYTLNLIIGSRLYNHLVCLVRYIKIHFYSEIMSISNDINIDIMIWISKRAYICHTCQWLHWRKQLFSRFHQNTVETAVANIVCNGNTVSGECSFGVLMSLHISSPSEMLQSEHTVQHYLYLHLVNHSFAVEGSSIVSIQMDRQLVLPNFSSERCLSLNHRAS